MFRLTSRCYSTPTNRLVQLGWMIALLTLAAALPLHAQMAVSPSGPPGIGKSLTLELAPIGFEHRFEADIDDGGNLEQQRIYGGLQVRLQPNEQWQFAFNTAYSYHHFRFSGTTGFGQLDPWDDVHLWTFSSPITFTASEHWQFEITPFLQLNKESDANAGESITGGSLLSAVYRFSNRLRLGLGLGGENRLEDGGGIFLFPIVEWQITDTLRLTGNFHPPFPKYTLELQAELSRAWVASLGIDLQEDRFRLDDQETAPKGIGSVHQGTLRASLSYRFQQFFQLTAYGGIGSGELTLEDKNGNEIRKKDIDPAPVLGLTLTTSY